MSPPLEPRPRLRAPAGRACARLCQCQAACQGQRRHQVETRAARELEIPLPRGEVGAAVCRSPAQSAGRPPPLYLLRPCAPLGPDAPVQGPAPRRASADGPPPAHPDSAADLGALWLQRRPTPSLTKQATASSAAPLPTSARVKLPAGRQVFDRSNPQAGSLTCLRWLPFTRFHSLNVTQSYRHSDEVTDTRPAGPVRTCTGAGRAGRERLRARPATGAAQQRRNKHVYNIRA